MVTSNMYPKLPLFDIVISASFVFNGNGDQMGISRKLCAQITEVNKPLLSVGRQEAAGYRVRFDGPNNSFIEDKTNGENMRMEKRGHVYDLRVFVRDTAAGFARQGS